MKKRKKVLLGIIVSIVLAVIAIVIFLLSSTSALFTHKDISTRRNNYNTGILSITAISKSDTISLDNTLPMSDESGAATTPYIFTIKNNGNVDYQFDVQLLATGANTFDPQYIKIKIDNNEVTTLSELTGSKIKSQIVLAAQQSIDVSIKVWLASNTPNTQIGKTFTSQLVINGVAVSPTTNYGVSAAAYITNLYNNSNKTVVQNNNIDYNYATSVSLMNDRLGGTTKDLNAGNIRYYGTNPNNYILFNCSDYSNQTSETCEQWRIIGVFDNMIKIIRQETIDSLTWDNTNSNNWGNSSLSDYLNNGNYWMVNINDQSKTMVADINWDLGSSHNPAADFSNNYYSSEKLYQNYLGVKTWNGKIGLIHLSDYGYSSDFNICTGELSNYDSIINCANSNWMFNLSKNQDSKLLTLDSAYDNGKKIFVINYSNGNVVYNDINANSSGEVKPVLYLNADESIASGTGTSLDPYKLR